jgi:hypothetical protein
LAIKPLNVGRELKLKPPAYDVYADIGFSDLRPFLLAPCAGVLAEILDLACYSGNIVKLLGSLLNFKFTVVVFILSTTLG